MSFSFLKYMTNWDKVLIIIVLLVALGGILYPFFFIEENSGERYAVVNYEGQEIDRFSLPREEEEIKEIEFEFEGEKYTAVLEFDEDRVRMHRLTEEISPLSIHADTGWIDSTHQMIVALPVKLSVEIVSSERDSDLDGVVF